MRKKRPKIIVEDILALDYAAGGKAIGKSEGKVIFIENCIPGDRLDVQLTKNKKDWAEGFPIHFRSYSPDRIEPFCDHFGICGGCSWQSLPYEKQLFYKTKQVQDNFERIGKFTFPEIQPIIGCDQTVAYRNKMEYTFSTKKYISQQEMLAIKTAGESFDPTADKGVAGFHAKGFFDRVVEIDTCHLQAEPTNKIRKFIAQFARLRNLPFYDIAAHTGWIRTVQVRNTQRGEWMVNVVIAYDLEEHRQQLMELLQEKFPEITCLLYTINDKKNDSLHDLEPVIVKGSGYILEELDGFKYKISPKSFFQTNSRQAETLYKVTREFAELKPDGGQILYDLYCGTGSIGIFCSAGASSIIGVEVVDDAITDARANAALNHLENCHFYTGDVIKICDDAFFEQHGRPDVIITDPPRAGMHEKLVQKLLEIQAPLMVYVSCNPATQARDLALLSEKYAITKVQPVDMFPHTLHIENVVQLKLKTT